MMMIDFPSGRVSKDDYVDDCDDDCFFPWEEVLMMGRIRQFSPSSVTSRLTLFFITISIITSSSLLAKYTFDQTTSSYGHDQSHDDADEEYVKENGTDDGDGDGGGGCALHNGWDGLLGFPIMSTGLRARKGAYAHSMYLSLIHI